MLLLKATKAVRTAVIMKAGACLPMCGRKARARFDNVTAAVAALSILHSYRLTGYDVTLKWLIASAAANMSCSRFKDRNYWFDGNVVAQISTLGVSIWQKHNMCQFSTAWCYAVFSNFLPPFIHLSSVSFQVFKDGLCKSTHWS